MNFHRPVQLLALCTKHAVVRCFTNSHANFNIKYREQSVCSQAVNDAEKVVGYPTSFLSLRWLLNDEIANIALHVRKLLGTNHPLLKSARDLLLGKQSPTWGLIVLLVSKAGGLKSHFPEVDCDITAGILHSQRVLAEVTEMVRMSNLIHKSLLNISATTENVSDINFGNKLALLTGDYLLSASFRELAGLKNQEVNELISTSLRDLTEAEFIEPRDKQNRPLPALPLNAPNHPVTIPNEFGTEPFKLKNILGNAKAEWTLRHLLGGASLLAKCCQGTLKLAGHSEHLQRQGYLFGRNVALAWQARIDQDYFSTTDKSSRFSLICAPLLFHLQSNIDYYKVLMDNIDDINFYDIREEVLKGPGLEKTKELQREFIQSSFLALDEFPQSDAREALANIINTM